MDGSLLDHHNYRFDAAIPTLEKLAKLNVPVIPTTSKTEAEVLALRLQLKNNHPFIIENGAAVLIPVNYFQKAPKGCEQVGGFWMLR